jgi:GT2 family glycosyltransferase/glycosyltransferase involved in cell wall biosynthesis
MSQGTSGLLVLGMHRSGTSAMARVLTLGGAEPGARLLGASPGNATGHWEDALAVEVHDRLLAALGCRWDEPFALPRGWEDSEAAAQARAEIAAYLGYDRARTRLFVVKDPRLSLFASLWRAEAQALDIPLGAIVMLRHPLEVAASLAVRDAIPLHRALVLWLDYMQAAVAEAEALPAALVGMDALLGDWRAVLAHLRALPGAGRLQYDAAAAAVDAFLDPALRHEHAGADDALPQAIGEAWALLAPLAAGGRIPAGTAAALASRLRPLRELMHPLRDETRVLTSQLWARIEAAEGALAAAAPTGHDVATIVDTLGDVRGDVAEATAGVASASDQVATLVDAQADTSQHLQALAEGVAAASRHLAALAGLVPEQAAMRAQLATLADVVPRHEAALSELAEVRVALTHTHAELVDTDRAFEETRAALARTTRELGAIRAERDALRAARDVLQAGRDALEAKARQGNAALAEATVELVAQRELAERRLHDIDRLASERDQLREAARRLDDVLASRSWRITRPLRVLVRILTGQWSAADTSRLRALGRGAAARLPFLSEATRARLVRRSLQGDGAISLRDLPDQAMAPLLALATPGADLPDVFVWAVIDWHFRFQRPQHLARALADKGHRVFYVSVDFVDDAAPGFHVEPLDGGGRLFQVHLNLRGAPQIYSSMPMPGEVEALKDSLGKLLDWTTTRSGVSLVQHPYWTELARSVPNSRLVYDCMDHHGGFENNSGAVLEAEHALVRDSELVIVTSAWLEGEFAGSARALSVIRNAGEHAFFATAPDSVFRDELGRKVIGYYGAIAEWFDLGLVREVAAAHPDALVVLVGHDSVGAASALQGLPNVRLVGEVPYTRLPYWVHGFDVCLLPFQVIPLTLATNPVKLYEYLAAGKPVVAVDLPEMAQFGDLVQVAGDHEAFVAEVSRALESPPDEACRLARQTFAAGQTWGHRAEALDNALRNLDEPRVSVVVLTYNNLAFTQACLDSIEHYSDYPNLEVLVVDNASSDGSRDYLARWAAQASPAGHLRRLVLNEDNLGFAAGNNVGLRAATGEILVMLNNDTYVTPGWVRTLGNHLRRDRRLGLVGPVTNNIGNEARIEIGYSDMSGMIREAGLYTRRHPGKVHPLHTAAFFCVALRREVYEALGGLDEAFGRGFFEDDDYCRRVQQAGWKVACAEDVFVHHHLSASFNEVAPAGRAELFERNKAIYERKWGPWRPHAYRSPSPPAS